MKKIFIFVTLLALLVVGSTRVNGFNFPSLNNLFSYSVCDNPIHYRVDTIDPKFNLSRDNFLSDINQATQIWNSSINKNLFAYDPKGDLSINLIYDERQSLNNQINQLENSIQSDKQSLNPQVSEYEKQSLEFKQRIENL